MGTARVWLKKFLTKAASYFSSRYLFWLIQGQARGGLYRLDLANISNGIKHEVIPDIILEDPNLGAFVVDHTNFCVLVPSHVKNTVFSVSLDG